MVKSVELDTVKTEEPDESLNQHLKVSRSRSAGSIMDRYHCKPPHLNLSYTAAFIRRRTTSTMWDTKFDPFQVFEVEHEACLDFEITITQGEAITKGSSFQDFMDTPDPYVVLKIPGSGNPSKRTSHIDNSISPIWNETFHFYLDPAVEHTLKVVLMDANYSMDETLGEDTICINSLTNDVSTPHTFQFSGGSKVHAVLKLEKNKTPDLRFSLALCKEEKEFLQIRRRKVLASMQKLLGPKAPDNERQVPIIGVLGSGGGFRAMTCLSGAIKALSESGVIDCTTYVAGLSGSSWYISSLFAHPDFPNVTHAQIQSELRQSVTTNWKWQLVKTPAYVASMMAKYKLGQPVSFTDFFGHLLGDVLLKKQKDKAKLSDARSILVQGIVPMPLCTCLHAKKKVSCQSFSEWVEFSPYEIGIAKYGTFMRTEDFGSKFIVGKKIKSFEEFPLHFLQGVWGSAFTILFKRLVTGTNKDIVQVMRDAQTDGTLEDNIEDTHSSAESSESEEENNIRGKDDPDTEEEEEDDDQFEMAYSEPSLVEQQLSPQGSIPEEQEEKTATRRTSTTALPSSIFSSTDQKMMTAAKSFDSLSLDGSEDRRKKTKALTTAFSFDQGKKRPSRVEASDRKISSASDPGVTTSSSSGNFRLQRQGAFKVSKISKEPSAPPKPPPVQLRWTEKRKSVRRSRAEKKAGLWDGLKENILTGAHILNSRAGRAGEVLNPFRGLSLRTSFPISPFAANMMGTEEDQEDEVDGEMSIGASCRYKPLDNKAKKLFIVDSGLAFNSPFPLLLRPQRAVDIYLSFDFSQRESDSIPPFKELLLAEKWAIQNKVSFPPIQKQVEEYEKEEEFRECYVFKHPSDVFCPVILHFPLINNKFKHFKAPGVPRETEEEKAFADFSLFDDPSKPFSSMNFFYESMQFDRLTKLVEFNTLLGIDTIKEELAEIVTKKKQNLTKLTMREVVKSVTRLTSIQSSTSCRDLRLRLSSQYLRQSSLLERQKSVDTTDNNSDSDYSDALEELPNEENTDL